jgi:hypothetical protein
MKANFLKATESGRLYVDMSESTFEEDDEELLAFEYDALRTDEHVGYVILNPRTWSTKEILDPQYIAAEVERVKAREIERKARIQTELEDKFSVYLTEWTKAEGYFTDAELKRAAER